MTINEAISRVDDLLHNTYSYANKVEWLSDLDWMIKKEIIDTHEGAESVNFTGYDNTTDMETELLAPPPYDKIYLRWLEAQIHKHNEEITKWNNTIVLYNNEWENFANYYNSNYRPISRGTRFVF